MIRGVLSGLAPVLLAILLAAPGCTKRIPVESGEFDVSQKVVLTLREDRTLKGRIGQGQRVEYRDGTEVYRARVASVSTESIQLENLVLVDRGDYGPVGDRLAHARTEITEPIPGVTVSRGDVERVELVKTDTYRTARSLGFWVYGSTVFLLLLGERS